MSWLLAAQAPPLVLCVMLMLLLLLLLCLPLPARQPARLLAAAGASGGGGASPPAAGASSPARGRGDKSPNAIPALLAGLGRAGAPLLRVSSLWIYSTFSETGT